MVCKLKIFDPLGSINNGFREFTCDEVRQLLPHWKEEFKKLNRCDEKDRYYIDYCEEIHSFLESCKCIH